MRSSHGWVWVFIAVAVTGLSCYDLADSEGAKKDAGQADAALIDVGSGGHDAGAGGDHGGGWDAAVRDSGAADTSVVDVGGTDSGPVDDAGDVSPVDAGGDAGLQDAGTPDAGVDPCLNHCTNGQQDCGETGKDCGGTCDACPVDCTGHCYNGKADCGESGKDCGGECSPCGSGGCSFPQGVPEGDFTSGNDTDGAIGNAVNAVMTALSGCNPGSDCYIGDKYPDGQPWFVDVAAALRDQGYCAGQHELGYTDEIAVSNTGCTGRWFGYHIYNYGGLKVVWSPGAARGWWAITPNHCV